METQLIESIFEPFFKEYHFEKTSGRYPDTICYKNEIAFIEFMFDKRFNELGITLSKSLKGKAINILELIALIKPNEFIDVFKYLKYEFENLDENLLSLKNNINHDHSLLLISVCSIMIRQFDEIITAFNDEF